MLNSSFNRIIKMKHIFLYFFIVVIIFITGCENNVNPVIPTEGEATLSSAYYDGRIKAFSFSSGGIVDFDAIRKGKGDFIAMIQTNIRDIGGMYLGPIGEFRQAFSLMKSFNDEDSAFAYFEDRMAIPDSNLFGLAILLSKYQIWGYKTKDNKFGKLLILESYADEKVIDGRPEVYGEVRFRWKFAPKGGSFL